MGVWLLSEVNPSAVVSPCEAASHLKSLYREPVQWDILEYRSATDLFIPPLIFPYSHFLDDGSKQERLKEERGLKKNKRCKKK